MLESDWNKKQANEQSRKEKNIVYIMDIPKFNVLVSSFDVWLCVEYYKFQLNFELAQISNSVPTIFIQSRDSGRFLLHTYYISLIQSYSSILKLFSF